MGSIGDPPTGHFGSPIVAMAARISAGLATHRADATNLALARVLELCHGGIDLIRSQDEPLALSQLRGTWFVREGVHRAIALVLLGSQVIEGIAFESGRLVIDAA